LKEKNIKIHITIIAALLFTSASFAGEPTFESIKKEFQQKTLALLPEKDVSPAEIQGKIAKFAEETFGAHPELMRKEAEARFKALPLYDATELTAYVEHKSWDQFPLSDRGDGWTWLMFGWDPEKLAESTKKAILSLQLGMEVYSRLALINIYYPDKVYRLNKGKFPDLVVDSLGDLFVIKVEMTEIGVCRPTSVQWMKKKKSLQTGPTPEK